MGLRPQNLSIYMNASAVCFAADAPRTRLRKWQATQRVSVHVHLATLHRRAPPRALFYH